MAGSGGPWGGNGGSGGHGVYVGNSSQITTLTNNGTIIGGAGASGANGAVGVSSSTIVG